MFEYISGIIKYIGPDYCVCDVNGVGFHINTSLNTLATISEGEICSIYTFMNVKEDDISLYGFSTSEEMDIFKLLLTVNGVGAKMALAILSGMSPHDFCIAVAKNDLKKITSAKGVGSKLAQRIILELKDKITADTSETEYTAPEITANSEINDAAEALVVLGKTPQEAKSAVQKVYKDGMSTKEIISLALRA